MPINYIDFEIYINRLPYSAMHLLVRRVCVCARARASFFCLRRGAAQRAMGTFARSPRSPIVWLLLNCLYPRWGCSVLKITCPYNIGTHTVLLPFVQLQMHAARCVERFRRARIKVHLARVFCAACIQTCAVMLHQPSPFLCGRFCEMRCDFLGASYLCDHYGRLECWDSDLWQIVVAANQL